MFVLFLDNMYLRRKPS